MTINEQEKIQIFCAALQGAIFAMGFEARIDPPAPGVIVQRAIEITREAVGVLRRQDGL
jgi:hypothetical protein